MNSDRLNQFIAQQHCPDLPLPLQALWYAKQGDWERAHVLIQDEADADSAWVHAYLHRLEGDLSNARCWYRRSGRSPANIDLDREWEEIAKSLLTKVSNNELLNQ